MECVGQAEKGWSVYHSFEELEVWKRACQLAVQVFEAMRETRIRAA